MDRRIFAILLVAAALMISSVQASKEEVKDKDREAMNYYYNVMGVAHTATDKEIKKAFRDMCTQFDPAHPKKDLDAERYREVVEAFQILANKKTRKIYDEQGEEGLKRSEMSYLESIKNTLSAEKMAELYVKLKNVVGENEDKKEANVLKQDVEAGREKLAELYQKAKDMVGLGAEKASEKTEKASDKVANAVKSAETSVKEKVKESEDTLSDLYQKVKNLLHDESNGEKTEKVHIEKDKEIKKDM